MKFCLFCLIYLSASFAIGQTTTIKVHNPDIRKYTFIGEKMILQASLSPAKGRYIIRASANGKRVYQLNPQKPTTQFYFYQTASKVGKHPVTIEIECMMQGTLKTIRRTYTYEVKTPQKNLFRRFFLNYPNEIPAYRNAGGKPIKVQFRGDTNQVKIYQGVHKIYLIPYQATAHVLEVYHKGRKIDQIQFQVMALPPPNIQLSYVRDSTRLTFDKNDSAQVLITLKESPVSLHLLNGASRQLLVEGFELTYFGRAFTGKHATRSVKMQGHIYRFDHLLRISRKTYENGQLVGVTKPQSGDVMMLKVLEASQLFLLPSFASKKGKSLKIPLPGYVNLMEYKLK